MVRVEMAPEETDFRDLVEPYLGELRSEASRLAGEEGEDLLQDCLAAAVGALARIRDRRTVGAWLHQILRRKWIDTLRRRYRDRRLGALVPPPSPTEPVDAEPVHRALRRMEPEERRILELRYFHGKSSPEIAALLGRPAGTVRSLLFYTLRKFEAVYWEEVR